MNDFEFIFVYLLVKVEKEVYSWSGAACKEADRSMCATISQVGVMKCISFILP